MIKTLIVALGGNALIRPGERGTTKEMVDNLRSPIRQIAELSNEYNIIITHGNGPQVGNLLIQQEATKEVSKMPLEILVAETQGQIGFLIESTLDEELMRLGLDLKKYFLTVLTYVEVDPNDPRFKKPTKPIGPAYNEKHPGFVETSKGWKRVVASPKPKKIIQWKEIKKLMEDNFIVIACGGGGIPVVKEDTQFLGVEAVIDKDLASAKLGEQIDADILLIATDVEKVALNYGKSNETHLNKLSIAKASNYLNEGQFPPGSMGPKVEAVINFLQSGGERGIITSIDRIKDALKGKAGTEFYIKYKKED
ncbi:MAG: carbamate kinase [Candidatus Lokiarchaeota archaeon]|nr:carbamate kinase [Candidatus Lokiarchaeota archaeon]MBD3199275.1 carbamate kinase [Candidatus Lokiarchaeota archaeon]